MRQKSGGSERTPYIERPIYFFLGDFADGADASRPCSVRIPLAALPADIVTFTFPDGMASLPLATRADDIAYRKHYHGQVFTLDEIKMVISEFGMLAERREPLSWHSSINSSRYRLGITGRFGGFAQRTWASLSSEEAEAY
jgi:hypothetical protein